MAIPVLDDLDRRILHGLYVNCRAPFSLLAGALGVSEQTVARRYRRLRDANVLRVVGQLDAARLGQSDWAVRIRCAPGTSPMLATELARRPETAWVQLVSGGTEIFSTIHAHDRDRRTPLLLGQLSAGRHVASLEASCLLHVFTTGPSPISGVAALAPHEIAQLQADRPAQAAPDVGSLALDGDDWPLVRALAEDGRATYRDLAERTHWHESTVRRRVEEMIASGLLYFDLDLDAEALGVRSRALLWMSVAPAHLAAAGKALGERPEVPFAAATTGSRNLMASLACADDPSLYRFLTEEIAALEGVNAIETAPVMRSVKMHATMALPDGQAVR